jgi:hypothetical protein
MGCFANDDDDDSIHMPSNDCVEVNSKLEKLRKLVCLFDDAVSNSIQYGVGC